jgi:toxin-antitoxin system PIN domain toxin
MIAVDTNILVCAHHYESPYNEIAHSSVTALAEGRESWAIPWPCIHEFLCVVTNPRAFNRPTPMEAALDQVEAWMESPGLLLLAEGERHWEHLSATVLVPTVRGPKVHDSRIAALCLAHGVRELWTADRDFARWPELATFNPLVADHVHETPPRYGAAVRARAAGLRRALASRVE